MDEGTNRLNETKSTGSTKQTRLYFARHELVAIALFSIAVILGNIWFYAIFSGMQEYLDREHIYFSEWIIAGVLVLSFLWILARHIIKVPVITAFGR